MFRQTTLLRGNMKKLRVSLILCLLLIKTAATASRRVDDGDKLKKLRELIRHHKNKSSARAEAHPVVTGTDVTINFSHYATVRFITTKVHTLKQDESMKFYAALCRQAQSWSVNVTLLLTNNPSWDPVKGIIEYYVIRTVPKEYQEALCTNVDADGVASASCLIKQWPDTNDLAIVATAGPVGAISFTVIAELFYQDSPSADYVAARVPTSRKSDAALYAATGEIQSTVFLTASLYVYPPVSIRHMQHSNLLFTLCSIDDFTVESTVFSTDGESAFTQYVCDSPYCDVGVNNIAHNGEQLPSNTIVTPTIKASGELLCFLVINWGGVYDPGKKDYIGRFLFEAHQVPVAE